MIDLLAEQNYTSGGFMEEPELITALEAYLAMDSDQKNENLIGISIFIHFVGEKSLKSEKT